MASLTASNVSADTSIGAGIVSSGLQTSAISSSSNNNSGGSMLSTDSPPFNPRGIYSSGTSPAPPLNSSSEKVPSNALPAHSFQGPDGETLEIRNVWAENLESEMKIIRELIETHPYVAMDTEFPGVVARPVSESYSPDYHYQSLKCNVDLLKIIQLGLSFADSEGVFAKGCPCWQFNFKFSLENDMFAQDSIDLLVNSGISFDDHATRGIDPLRFGELLMVSGLVLDDRVKWVSFHSGYDYGYLLKLLTTVDLPDDEKSFFETLKMYFSTIYDIKYMTSLIDGHFLKGGLQKIADDLGCTRIGPEHQAGSDSLLTMTTYFALARKKFQRSGKVDDSKFINELFGYGSNHTVHKARIRNEFAHSASTGALMSLNSSNDINE